MEKMAGLAKIHGRFGVRERSGYLKQHENSKPNGLGSRVEWLRGSSSDSKNFMLILPVFTHKTRHGEKIIAIDPNEVQKYLDLTSDDVARLTRRFLYPKPQPSRLKRMLLDRRALAIEYRQLIDSGVCRNQADVARRFGVSRAWVTKIMNSLQPLHPVRMD